MSENSISVIKPYKWEGLWVFDDPRVDLVREPFVAGADTMIDIALQEKGIENADSGFLLVFSATRFPGVDLELSWVKEDCIAGRKPTWKDGCAQHCSSILRNHLRRFSLSSKRLPDRELTAAGCVKAPSAALFDAAFRTKQIAAECVFRMRRSPSKRLHSSHSLIRPFGTIFVEQMVDVIKIVESSASIATTHYCDP